MNIQLRLYLFSRRLAARRRLHLISFRFQNAAYSLPDYFLIINNQDVDAVVIFSPIASITESLKLSGGQAVELQRQLQNSHILSFPQ